jgi:hypothetical protein
MAGDDTRSATRSGLIASVLVILALVPIYIAVSGEDSPDWVGYRALYDGFGGWLLATGRDALFVKLLDFGYALFGFEGYGHFRLAIFLVILVVAAWTAFMAPKQTSLGAFSPIAIALAVATTFLLKGLVQIREGLAFVFILIPVAGMYGRGQRGVVRSVVGAAVASAIHVAEAMFLALWAPALVASRMPRLIADWRTRWAVTVLGVAIGVTVAWALNHLGDTLLWELRDYSIDTSASPTTGLWKDAYWLFNGGAVFMLRRQVLAAVNEARPFALAWATGLVCGALPALYATCLVLATSGYAIPAVTSIAIRLLYTSMELGLLIIALRGRMNLITVALAGAMLADRLRLLASQM